MRSQEEIEKLARDLAPQDFELATLALTAAQEIGYERGLEQGRKIAALLPAGWIWDGDGATSPQNCMTVTYKPGNRLVIFSQGQRTSSCPASVARALVLRREIEAELNPADTV